MGTTFPAGYQLGPYVIQSLVGRGGMGVVYAAEHTTLQRRVALKVIAPEVAEDDAFRDRFLREARIAASLHHPNIIEIYDAGQAGGELYLAMRYVDGASLATILRLAGRLDAERALSILGKVAGALDEAHANGLIHRDVKPDNILLGAPASRRTEEVYLTDFGLVRRVDGDTRFTQTGSVLGTLSYLAPECVQDGQIDGRSDQYSLACVLYECLTGRVPFSREMDAGVLVAHLTSPPPTVSDERPDLDPRIDAVVAKGMAKAKEDRYGSCAELIEDARSALTGGSAPADALTATATEIVPGPVSEPPSREPITAVGVSDPRSRRTPAFALIVLAIAVVAGGLALALAFATRPGPAVPTSGPGQASAPSPPRGSGASPSGTPTPQTSNPSAPVVVGGGTWTRTGSLDAGRWGHGVAMLPGGRVLVVGGNTSKDSSSAVASAESYDPVSAGWTPMASMRQPRAYPSATVLTDGTVLVTGGAFDNAPLASAELYDPAAGTWASTGKLTMPRLQQTATLLADGRVLVVGGGTTTKTRASSASAEIYDPTAGTWTRTAPMAVPRSYHTATRLEDGRVLVVGGSSTYVGAGSVRASAEIFDPKTGRWTSTGPMAAHRYVHDAVLLQDGRVLVAGGWSSTDLEARSLRSAEVFDPRTGRWFGVGDMTKGRAQFRMAVLRDGRVLAVGGLSPQLAPQATTELFDPVAGTWSPTGAMLDASWWPSLVVLPDGRALVAGGSSDKSGAVPLAGAELYAPPSR